jgi:hypothetical protein
MVESCLVSKFEGKLRIRRLKADQMADADLCLEALNGQLLNQRDSALRQPSVPCFDLL